MRRCGERAATPNRSPMEIRKPFNPLRRASSRRAPTRARAARECDDNVELEQSRQRGRHRLPCPQLGVGGRQTISSCLAVWTTTTSQSCFGPRYWIGGCSSVAWSRAAVERVAPDPRERQGGGHVKVAACALRSSGRGHRPANPHEVPDPEAGGCERNKPIRREAARAGSVRLLRHLI